MSINYKVTIAPAKKPNEFHITWYNLAENTEYCFDVPAQGITREEVEKLWQKPGNQLTIGKKLFRFLDGEACRLQAALDEAARHGESLQLHLCACKQTADWPFELLARDGLFLLPHRLHLVRMGSITDWGTKKESPPGNRPLKMLFMACSALDVEPELDFEKEEEAIFRITEKLAVDMEVEDSGSLEGLRDQLEQEQYDIVHLSGHADIDTSGKPFFIMEDETGFRRDVLPYELWQKALIENPPRLLFLSGCRTGETPDVASFSFARMLAESYHVPAVLGWGRSVSDEQATHAEKMIYHELSRGKTILEAVQRARYELITNFESSSSPAWPLLRLFSSGEALNAIVEKGQRPRPRPRRMKHVYLKQSRVQVLAEGFVGRRRHLQQSLRTLKQDFDKVGVLLHGTGGLGKSCLAGKLSERFSHHTLIIVHGRLNTITLEAALKDAFVLARDENGKQILAEKKEMKEKLADLCAASFKEKNYLLLLDDFEQNLEGADQGQPGPLLPEAFDLLEVLLHYLPFSGKMTQLLITCRYRFSLEEQGNDLVEERLEPVCLTSFQESEQFKKARELKNILTYADQSAVPQLLTAGHGNPRLMEWLDILVGEMAEAEVPQLLDAIRNKQEEFIRKHVIRELLHRGGDELARFLRWLGIFRRPVLLEGVQEVGDKAGLKGWKELLEQGLSLSLVEHDQARKSYVVTPLLREELSADLEDLQFCHEAAFAYYKKICEPTEQLDHILFEEWIFHALGCGEEDTASEQGGLLVTHLRERLAFQESRRVGQWVMAKKKRKLSTEHDAFLLYELAFTINDLGDHRNAISHYEQTLTIARANFGEKHPHVGSTLNSLGTAWHALGDYHKAIEYFEQALNIDLLVFGDEHPEVANVLNNLGATWDGLGNHHKAIDYYQQALTIFKKVYGEKHPQIAAGWNNLGTACYDLGDYRKAIDYFEQALLIDRALYGDEHPDVAARLNNLGDAWRVLGEPRKAIAYLEKALIIDQTVFGEEHPKISTRLNNLGSAWYDLGDYHKAIDYYEQALSIDLVVFGEKHYNVARHLNNLGSVWFALGDHRRAIDYFEQALKIRKEVLGEKHPDVATILSNLGAACYGLSDHRRAIDYFEQALKIWKAVVGEKHPQVATILNNLGLAWQASGELKKAVEYCHHALNIDRSVYGDEHPDVARDLSNLGTAYIALGKNAEAKGYFEQAYAIFKKFFGEEHPHTKTASGWLEKCSKG